ncbi:MAG: ATP-binding cassette domain-containing protein [Candidatus Saccharibacteria bacterium]|nr:ATP-binding cassette domain-containing protein [Candidatus Saccharibacteria bacterium]
MLLQVGVQEKSFGTKMIFDHLKFDVDDHEKVGIIGRNGIGKSTLFGIIENRDHDYTGRIIIRRGATVVGTSQEYHDAGDKTVTEYILSGLPNYAQLAKVLREFPLLENPSNHQLNVYSEALTEFGNRGYYNIDGQVQEELKKFQLEKYADSPFASLSGGQKRLSEVVKIMHSNAQLALVDEPTNFMDYVAKDQFIDWMKKADEAIVVITHDRDVLQNVDRIIEIKDGGCQEYRGNYDDYIRQNFHSTSNAMKDYELVERRITNLKQKVLDYQRLKEKARNPSTIHQFKRLEMKAREELAELERAERPSFWIDEQSLTDVGYKDADRYAKYKARNIKISTRAASNNKSDRVLAYAHDLAVGYADPLFCGINFDVRSGDKLELHGRNGVGKSTLIKAMLGNPNVTIFDGKTGLDTNVRLGIYEQEVSDKYFNMTLAATIEHIYLAQGLPISDTKVRSLMSNYLFSEGDRNMLVRDLSGGQKARLQIISMLANDPNLIILDEPTSHLDLPSIEELERALINYHGAIIYISHDNYFRRKLGGTTIEIEGL